MSQKRMSRALDVFLNGNALGVLRYQAKTDLEFVYNREWLSSPTAFPISRSLPLREEPYGGASVYSYFDNLLPDVLAIRSRIAATTRAKSDHVFDLLEKVGKDCVGALQFVSTGSSVSKPGRPKGSPIDSLKIAEKLKELHTQPLGISEDEAFRLSIAGAQEKTAFLKIKDEWNTPLGVTPTTHIFKPQSGRVALGYSFSDSVENEWLCSEIAAEYGFTRARSEIMQFGEVKTLVLERFDRAWIDKKLIRLPQEDVCQALGVPSFKKYESEGGPGISDVMTLLNESNKRDEDRDTFVRVQVLFLLLGAIDGHGKNFSIAWRSTGFSLAPLYDVLSAYPLIKQGRLPREKAKMAMSFGTKPHYSLITIFRRHLLQTAKKSRFDQGKMETIIDEMLVRVPAVIDSVKKKLPPSFPEKVSNAIFEGMRERVVALQKDAQSGD
jgi:serine/threonine-protein kinase HipA